MKLIQTVLFLMLTAVTVSAQANGNAWCADAFETAQQEKSTTGATPALRVVNAGGACVFSLGAR